MTYFTYGDSHIPIIISTEESELLKAPQMHKSVFKRFGTSLFLKSELTKSQIEANYPPEPELLIGIRGVSAVTVLISYTKQSRWQIRDPIIKH